MDAWKSLLTDPQVLAALITFALGAVWQLSVRAFAAKPRLRWGQTSDTTFLVPMVPAPQPALPTGATAAPTGELVVAPPVPDPAPPAAGILAVPRHETYHARNIWLVNSGNAIAEDVELAFNWPPQHIEWYPHLPTTITRQPDGRYIITIARLNPKEGVNFSMLSLNQEHPGLLHVRCKGYQAKGITFTIQQVYPKWFNASAFVLWLLGVYTVVSWLTSAALTWLWPAVTTVAAG